MISLLRRLFLNHWPRKAFALALALIIWIMINHSITVTRTFPGVLVRVVNLPPNKTIVGLMPDGVLETQTTITLTGRKSALDALTSHDLEVVIDARNKGDQWIVRITKQMLVSTNPDIDLGSNITDVNHGEFVIRLSELVTEKIPISITRPTGEPPVGYQFLDIWPQSLYQTVSGPKEEVDSLKLSGLELTFDLSAVPEKELDALSKGDSTKNDEISYLVPPQWKKVHIPYLGDQLQDLNDPASDLLRIDFLRKELLSLEAPLPLLVFYPLTTSNLLNPGNTQLLKNEFVGMKNEVFLLNMPLYASNVSRLFLDIVKDNLALSIIAAPSKDHSPLDWSIQYIDPKKLEDAYVTATKSDLGDRQAREGNGQLSEKYLRARFQNYMRYLNLYITQDKRLRLDIQLADSKILVKSVS